MTSIEDALRKIAEQTGSHTVSVSLHLEAPKLFSVFLHPVSGSGCHHGMGASIDAAVEAALDDYKFARAS